MRLPSVMSHSFSQVPSADIPRASFDRSHGYKTTLDAGYLVPIFLDEVLPGDTFNLSMTGFARMSTPIKPIMDNAYFNSFFIYVPTRLIWDKWREFNGQQRNPGDSTDFLVPQIVSPATTGWTVGTLADYFGLSTQVPGVSVSALPFRAYNLIWNEWFRDENLQNSVPNATDNGPDPVGNYSLLRRGKRHDYFTSSLPWPQKGASVTVPLGSTAPVIGIPGAIGGRVPKFTSSAGTADSFLTFQGAGTLPTQWSTGQTLGNAAWSTTAGATGLVADLSNSSSSTINQLRQAFQIQKLYERDARGGTRYTEIIRAHFGVISPDARLQRPEYLGGGQSPVIVNQVPQTSASVTGAGGGGQSLAQTPQGGLAAYGTSQMHGHSFSKSFTEHGYVIGLICIRADLTYQRGNERMWYRKSRFDFYWPALSHIGEQAVLSQEIYVDGTTADQTVWGYQERYAEYRYKPSKITGQFRSNYAQSLDSWHLSQDFGTTRPLLNATFIAESPPFARVVAVPSEPNFIADFYFSYRCARPMPVYGVPGLIDHF